MGRKESSPVMPPEPPEAYWQAIKYVIIGLTVLMVLAVLAAVVVVLRLVPWS